MKKRKRRKRGRNALSPDVVTLKRYRMSNGITLLHMEGGDDWTDEDWLTAFRLKPQPPKEVQT